MTARASTLLLLLTFLAASRPVQAQVRVQSNVPDDHVDNDFPVQLTVSGELAEGERLAVMIGSEDVTALLTPTSGGLAYPSHLLALPTGNSDVAVYHVAADGRWNRLAAFPLKVRSSLGVEETDFAPRLDLTFSAQPADGEDPEPVTVAEVPEILDGKIQLDAGVVHRSFSLKATATTVGTSERERRLRFRELEDDAPLLDLSSYRLDHEQGPVKLSLGHVRAGNQKHLISGFGSRGATMTIAPSTRVDLNVGANAGRQEVGWSNLLGVGDPDHRVLSASLGLEALERPGALRVEVGWMGGSILPRSGFNRGDVTDAETSDGFSVRVQAQGLDRRLRLDAGWARSSFDNPEDPTLNQGLDVVQVRETTKDARYVDANLELLRGLKLWGTKTGRLSVGWSHERVDPLYRTVATSVRADNLQDQVDVRADVAGISIQGNVSRAEDNLDEIASILKSKTERTSLNVGIPLPRMAGNAAWLPNLSYRNDRTHQFGVALPENGGFSEGHIPDQVSVNQSLSADWRAGPVTFRWQLDHRDQDNRQASRETADFENLNHGFGLGLTPHRALQLAFDLGLERADDLGADERDNTRRWGANATWRPFDRTTLGVRFSDTFQDDDAGTEERTSRSFDARLSSKIPYASRFNGTWFVRFNRSENGRFDLVQDVTQDRTKWVVNLGASMGLARR